jgi:hypothetical protein
MKFLSYLVIVSIIVAFSECSKVIFARNTTAAAIRQAEKERLEAERDSKPMMSTIINAPSSCKPGYAYESTFHNRCRKIAR